MNKASIGIFGGMGPLTGAEFYMRFEKAYPATSDSEHPIVYLFSDPTLPRKDVGVLKALKGENPTELIKGLIRGLNFFKSQNVDFVVCPCNTFHYFREALEESVGIKILNMISVVAKKVVSLKQNVKSVTLLSTEATAISGLYQKEFLRYDIDVEILASDKRKMVMEIIELVKSGKANDHYTNRLFVNLIQSFQGKKYILLACTELSLVPIAKHYKGDSVRIDTTDCLVHGAIDKLQQGALADERSHITCAY